MTIQGTLAKVWKKANLARPVRIWRRLRRTTKKSHPIRLRKRRKSKTNFKKSAKIDNFAIKHKSCQIIKKSWEATEVWIFFFIIKIWPQFELFNKLLWWVHNSFVTFLYCCWTVESIWFILRRATFIRHRPIIWRLLLPKNFVVFW